MGSKIKIPKYPSELCYVTSQLRKAKPSNRRVFIPLTTGTSLQHKPDVMFIGREARRARSSTGTQAQGLDQG